MVIASKFGAGLITDAFFIAFMIPNLFRQLFGEGALSAAFIPVFSDYLVNKEKKDAWQLANLVINLLLLISIVITILGIIFAPYVVCLIAPGFSKNVDLAILLTQVMFPFMILICTAALLMGILNACQHFSISALAPVLLNISMICSVYFISPFFKEPILGLALGVLLGGFLQVAVQIIPLLRKGYTYKFNLSLNHPGIKKIGNLMIPAVMGLAITQVNLVISRSLASFLGTGSISALYYANNLIWLPIALFGVSLGTVSFAMMSSQVAKEDFSSLRETLILSLRMLIMTTIPASIGLIVLGEPIITLLFQRNEFTLNDTIATNIALFYYALGIFAFASLRVITPVFYAFKDTKTPLKTGAVAVICNLGLSILLLPSLKHGGLALATTLSASLNFVILMVFLKKKVGSLKDGHLLTLSVRTLVASLIMGITCFIIINNVKYSLWWQVLVSIFSGILVLSICYKLFKIKEMDSLIKKLATYVKSLKK